MKLLKRNLAGAAILAGAVLLPGVAFASTAANTTITNTVTVNFNDAANNPQTAVEDSVAITVNLVASAPIVSTPAGIDPTTENTSEDLDYVVTSTANGPDDYNFSSVDSPTNMDDDAGFTTPSVTLGATTVAEAVAIGVNTITVPYDGTDDDDVNGIVVGDIVVIAPGTGDEEAFEVTAVDESGGGANNVVTITLDGNTANAHAPGIIIGERQTVTVAATTDEITTGTSGTHSVVTTVTSDEDAAVSTDSGATVITVRRPTLSVTKYVRNVTDPVVGAGAYTFDGTTWYTSGVNGAPGDVMEYLIIVDNTDAGAGTANNIVISDPIPMFTGFVDGIAGDILLDDDGTAADIASFSTEAVAVDSGSAAELDTTDNGTLYVYAGTGGDDSAAGAGNGAGGTLTGGQSSRVIFQVTID